MGYHYSRLVTILRLPLDDADESQAYETIMKRIQNCRELAAEYRRSPGMTGQTRDAAVQWLADYEQTIDRIEATVNGARVANEQAIQAIRDAQAEGEELSPVLVSHFEAQVLSAEPQIWIDGLCYSGAAYVDRLRADREREREDRARQILTAMNSETSGIAIEPVPVDSSAGGEGGAPPSSVPAGSAASTGAAGTGSAPGRGTGGASGVFGIGLGTTAAAGTAGSAWVARVPSTGPGSRNEPITDPAALEHVSLSETPVNPRMTPDGPKGGYLPPAVTQRDDPRWSAHYSAPGFGSGAAHGGRSAMMAGGMLVGVGGALAARSASVSGLSGSLALGSPAAAGLRGGVPAGGMLPGVSATGGPAAGAGGAGSAGGSSAGGGSGAAGAQGAAAGQQGVRRPFMGSAGAGAGEDEDERPTRHGYAVFRLDPEAPAEHSHHPLMDAGNADDVQPWVDPDQDDRW